MQLPERGLARHPVLLRPVVGGYAESDTEGVRAWQKQWTRGEIIATDVHEADTQTDDRAFEARVDLNFRGYHESFGTPATSLARTK